MEGKNGIDFIVFRNWNKKCIFANQIKNRHYRYKTHKAYFYV